MRDQDKQHRLEGPDAPATAELMRIFARHGFTSSEEPSDVADASTVAETALGGALASPDIVLACQARTERCFFIRRNEHGEASGFIALLFLNAAGFEALMYGRLSPDNPRLDQLTAPDERASAIYVWCLAGVSEADYYRGMVNDLAAWHCHVHMRQARSPGASLRWRHAVAARKACRPITCQASKLTATAGCHMSGGGIDRRGLTLPFLLMETLQMLS